MGRLIAIADQGRAIVGKGSLDGPSQTLPALYAASPTDYHSVATASSYFPYGSGLSFGGFEPFATPTHDFTFGSGFGYGSGLSGSTTTSAGDTANTSTGLGSPQGPSIVADLVSTNLISSVPSEPTSANSTKSTAKRARHVTTRHPKFHRPTVTHNGQSTHSR